MGKKITIKEGRELVKKIQSKLEQDKEQCKCPHHKGLDFTGVICDCSHCKPKTEEPGCGCSCHELSYLINCDICGCITNLKPQSECKHNLSLICNNCDATWGDPERARSMLVKWMSDKPALRHNVEECLKHEPDLDMESECKCSSEHHYDPQLLTHLDNCPHCQSSQERVEEIYSKEGKYNFTPAQRRFISSELLKQKERLTKEYLEDQRNGEIITEAFTESKIDTARSDERHKTIELIKSSKPNTYVVGGKLYNHSYGGKLAIDQYESVLLSKLGEE